MRLGLKSMLLMVGGYCLLIGAFAFGVDRWLRAFENEVALQTASLLARETAALLSERTYAALLAPDAQARALLREPSARRAVQSLATMSSSTGER